MRDLALVFLAGALSGILVIGGVRKRNGMPKKDKPLARLLAALLEPIFYWCDLTGADELPSHSKVVYFGTLLVLLGFLVSFGTGLLTSGQGMTWPFVGYAIAVMAFAMGKHSFNAVSQVIAGKFGSPERVSGSFRRPSGRWAPPSVGNSAAQTNAAVERINDDDRGD